MSGATLDDMRGMLADEAGLVTVATIRDNGDPLLSIVNAGVIEHPVSGEPVIAFVSGGSAVRLTHLRKRPHLTVLVRRSWQWAAASGDAELIGPDDQPDKLTDADHDVASLIRAVFVGAGGTHDDWDTFDEVMRNDRRCAVLLSPQHLRSN